MKKILEKDFQPLLKDKLNKITSIYDILFTKEIERPHIDLQMYWGKKFGNKSNGMSSNLSLIKLQ